MISYCEHKFLTPMEMAMPLRFGTELKKIREQRRWTQSDLAAHAKVSLSTIQKCEASDVPSLHWRNFIAIAEALGLSEAQLEAAWQGEMTTLELSIPRDVLERIAKAAGRDDQLVDRYAVRLLARAVAAPADSLTIIERGKVSPPAPPSASAKKRTAGRLDTASQARSHHAKRK